jgi:glycosyltransferase involved in cell wall biosynthesis
MKILFFDNNTGLDTVRDLDKRARGGMVSSLFILSDLFSDMGHDVWVLGDIKHAGVTPHGVKWENWTSIRDISCDVLVMNRGVTDDGLASVPAKHRVLWTHDLPHVGHLPQTKLIKAFDSVVFMSKYAKDVWTEFFPTITKYTIIPNGVDKNLFYPREKNLDYIIFGGAPNRGLNYLNLILAALRSRVRKSLFLNAYSNAEILHPNENTSHEIPMLGVMEFKGDKNFTVLDPIPQHKWARELSQAGLMIMPTSYPEICSNNILQSLACGTPVVTTGNLGSVPEWVKSGKNGFLTKYLPNDYMIYIIELVRGAKAILENPRLHKKMIKNAQKTKGILTWVDVAKKWLKTIGRL